MEVEEREEYISRITALNARVAELEAEVERKGLRATTISKAFKFIAAAGVVASAVLKWLGILHDAGIGEICAAWAVVYGLGAGTIDANIIIDKFTGAR